jgi:hypothetical protein
MCEKSFQILGNNAERLKYITREKYEKSQPQNSSLDGKLSTK